MRVIYLLAGLLRLRPPLARTFFQDPPGWKIVPVGDPESSARFEVVRTR